MLFQIEAFEGSIRQRDLLGYSRRLDNNDDEVASSAVIAATAGQFDDADDEIEHCIENKTFITAEHGPVKTVQPPALPSTAHPLQWLAEAACEQEEISRDSNIRSPVTVNKASGCRTPKRVSLSPGHYHKEIKVPKLDEPTSPFVPTLSHAASSRQAEDEDNVEIGTNVHLIPQESSTPSVLSTELAQSQTRKSFNVHYGHLFQFYQKHGHSLVPTRGEHKRLGRWLSNLRCKFRDGGLPPDQLKNLLQLGCVGFDADIPQDMAVPTDSNKSDGRSEEGSGGPGAEASNATCNDKEDQLKSRDEIEIVSLRHGHSHASPPPRVPFSVRGPRSIPPNSAVSNPLPFRPLPMPPMQRPFPVAARSTTNDDSLWKYRLHQLGCFKLQYGHTNVSTTLVATNKNEYQDLSLWLATQRHNHKKGLLPADRANVLHAYFGCPGFEPSTATNVHPAQKEDRYASDFGGGTCSGNKHHQKSHNHVVYGHRSAVVRTGNAPYHCHILPQTKSEMHSAEAVRAQIYQHGNVQQPVGNTRPQVAKPVKVARKRGQYTGWHDRLEQLIEFKRKNGHCEVRIMMHDECKELGRWLASQRHQFRKGKLPQDKVEILQRMGVNLTFAKPTAS
jgi:Helicase associated domain